MDTIALVGPSGTGKSHRALIVAHEYDVDTIIDDGLLIKDSKIIAGYSAKKSQAKFVLSNVPYLWNLTMLLKLEMQLLE